MTSHNEFGLSRAAGVAWDRLQAALEDAPAACAGMDSTMWLAPDEDTLPAVLRVCGSCPVVEACGAFAEAARVPDGVWGGRCFSAALVKRVGLV